MSNIGNVALLSITFFYKIELMQSTENMEKGSFAGPNTS